MTIKRVLLAVALLVAAAAAFMVAKIGPSNVIGMLRYDTRKEVALHPGSLAPDVTLHAVAGAGTVRIADHIGRRPLVLVFGSFT
jgi:hypothetical protein